MLAHSVGDSKLSEDNRRIRKSTQSSIPTNMKLKKIVSIQENATTGHKFSAPKNVKFRVRCEQPPKEISQT